MLPFCLLARYALQLQWLILLVASVPAPDEQLETLVVRALQRYPAIAAARERVGQPLARQQGVDAFFDPTLSMTAGGASRARAVPGAAAGYALPDDAWSAEGGIELPLRPGAYLSLGGAERYRRHAGDPVRDLYQTLWGLQVRVPLRRDRGFRDYHLARDEAAAAVARARAVLLQAAQQLRYQVETGYIAVVEARELLAVATAARARVERLLSEGRELARLKVVPEYQLLQARLEVDLRAEEAVAARTRLETTLVELARLTGLSTEQLRPLTAVGIVAWAPTARVDGALAPAAAAARRGLLVGLEEERRRLAAARERVAEQLKSDLSLTGALTWAGDSPHAVVGTDSLLADHHAGASVQLVWTRPLRHTETRARLQELGAEARVVAALMRQETVDVAAELGRARVRFGGAMERFRLVSAAVAVARRTLAAETERFRLGDGRSRSVLDAEDDLTDVIERRTRVAAEVLRARAAHRLAAGFLGARGLNILNSGDGSDG